MGLETIQLRSFDDPERQAVQAEAVRSAIERTTQHMRAYDAHPHSFGGRYIAADLFKETFDAYAASKDARNRFNTPIHNAATVLAAERFRMQLESRDEPHRREAIFLTGSPGAGKTSSVIDGGFPRSSKLIFEGQMARAASSLPKLEQALAAGFEPIIVVVHAWPEEALRNTLKRFNEEGRGASIGVMADIQGGLPNGLDEIRKTLGDAVRLVIHDVRDRSAARRLQGWDNLHVLTSEGNRDRIEHRLRAELDRLREAGRIGDAADRQARGLAPGPRATSDPGRVERPGTQGPSADGSRRDLPALDRKASFLTEPAALAVQRFPDLANAFAALDKLGQHLRTQGLSPQARTKAFDATRQAMAQRIGEGHTFAPVANPTPVQHPERPTPDRGR